MKINLNTSTTTTTKNQIQISYHCFNFQLNSIKFFKLETFFTTTPEVSIHFIKSLWLDCSFFFLLVYWFVLAYVIWNTHKFANFYLLFIVLVCLRSSYLIDRKSLLWRRGWSVLIVIVTLFDLRVFFFVFFFKFPPLNFEFLFVMCIDE